MWNLTGEKEYLTGCFNNESEGKEVTLASGSNIGNHQEKKIHVQFTKSKQEPLIEPA